MKKLFFIIPFVFIGAIIYFLFYDAKTQEPKLVSVIEGNITLSLHERGVLHASRDVSVKSPIVSNRAKLVEMLPEGSKVQKGDMIARLDTKPFLDDISNWKYKIQEAEVALLKAEKELKVHQNKSIESIKKISASIEIEQLNLKNIKNGDGLNKLYGLQQKVAQANRSVKLKNEELADYESLFSQGYISQKEKDKIAYDLLNAKESLQSATNSLNNYQKFVWPKELKEQKIKLDELKENKKNRQIQNQIILDQYKSQLQKAKAVLHMNKQELKKAETNVALCNIKAPISGTILYQEIPKNGKRAKIEVGDSIWHNQTFMTIPDTRSMNVVSKIREVDLSKISLLQKATITLDAFMDKKFQGTIIYIDSIAKFDDNNPNIKFFDTVISIKNSAKLLRSGMSAEVSIQYLSLNNILKLQAQAVFEENGKYFVRKKVNENFIKHPIKIGIVGANFIQIVEGLKKGDKVLML